jgi:hypothetical protein
VRSHLDMLVHLRYIRCEHFGGKRYVAVGGRPRRHLYSPQFAEQIRIRDAGFRLSKSEARVSPQKGELTLQVIMGALGKLETFIRNTK